jgi:hypothetical protein
MVHAPKARLQEPLVRICLVLLRQMHQHRYEEAVSEDKLALGVVAARLDVHRL